MIGRLLLSLSGFKLIQKSHPVPPPDKPTEACQLMVELLGFWVSVVWDSWGFAGNERGLLLDCYLIGILLESQITGTQNQQSTIRTNAMDQGISLVCKKFPGVKAGKRVLFIRTHLTTWKPANFHILWKVQVTWNDTLR